MLCVQKQLQHARIKSDFQQYQVEQIAHQLFGQAGQGSVFADMVCQTQYADVLKQRWPHSGHSRHEDLITAFFVS